MCEGYNPTHFFSRYPLPKSLPSGKGLTLALAGSKSYISNSNNFLSFTK